jgi:hypothetical protein
MQCRVFYVKQNMSGTEICLRLQLEPTVSAEAETVLLAGFE